MYPYLRCYFTRGVEVHQSKGGMKFTCLLTEQYSIFNLEMVLYNNVLRIKMFPHHHMPPAPVLAPR